MEMIDFQATYTRITIYASSASGAGKAVDKAGTGKSPDPSGGGKGGTRAELADGVRRRLNDWVASEAETA